MWHEMSGKVVCALVSMIVLTGAAQAAPLPDVNAIVTMAADFFGCRALSDLTQVITLDWVKNDKTASAAYGNEHCAVLRKGEQFRVDAVSVVRGAVCLRERRSSECYWTSAQVLKNP